MTIREFTDKYFKDCPDDMPIVFGKNIRFGVAAYGGEFIVYTDPTPLEKTLKMSSNMKEALPILFGDSSLDYDT